MEYDILKIINEKMEISGKRKKKILEILLCQFLCGYLTPDEEFCSFRSTDLNNTLNQWCGSGSVSFWSAGSDPGSKKSAKIMENFHENQRKT